MHSKPQVQDNNLIETASHNAGEMDFFDLFAPMAQEEIQPALDFLADFLFETPDENNSNASSVNTDDINNNNLNGDNNNNISYADIVEEEFVSETITENHPLANDSNDIFFEQYPEMLSLTPEEVLSAIEMFGSGFVPEPFDEMHDNTTYISEENSNVIKLDRLRKAKLVSIWDGKALTDTQLLEEIEIKNPNDTPSRFVGYFKNDPTHTIVSTYVWNMALIWVYREPNSEGKMVYLPRQKYSLINRTPYARQIVEGKHVVRKNSFELNQRVQKNKQTDSFANPMSDFIQDLIHFEKIKAAKFVSIWDGKPLTEQEALQEITVKNPHAAPSLLIGCFKNDAKHTVVSANIWKSILIWVYKEPDSEGNMVYLPEEKYDLIKRKPYAKQVVEGQQVVRKTNFEKFQKAKKRTAIPSVSSTNHIADVIANSMPDISEASENALIDPEKIKAAKLVSIWDGEPLTEQQALEEVEIKNPKKSPSHLEGYFKNDSTHHVVSTTLWNAKLAWVYKKPDSEGKMVEVPRDKYHLITRKLYAKQMIEGKRVVRKMNFDRFQAMRPITQRFSFPIVNVITIEPERSLNAQQVMNTNPSLPLINIATFEPKRSTNTQAQVVEITTNTSTPLIANNIFAVSERSENNTRKKTTTNAKSKKKTSTARVLAAMPNNPVIDRHIIEAAKLVSVWDGHLLTPAELEKIETTTECKQPSRLKGRFKDDIEHTVVSTSLWNSEYKWVYAEPGPDGKYVPVPEDKLHYIDRKRQCNQLVEGKHVIRKKYFLSKQKAATKQTATDPSQRPNNDNVSNDNNSAKRRRHR